MPNPVQLELYDFEELPVKALDERNHLKISVYHTSIPWGPRNLALTKHERSALTIDQYLL